MAKGSPSTLSHPGHTIWGTDRRNRAERSKSPLLAATHFFTAMRASGPWLTHVWLTQATRGERAGEAASLGPGLVCRC